MQLHFTLFLLILAVLFNFISLKPSKVKKDDDIQTLSKISRAEECKEDIVKLCPDIKDTLDPSLLACFQDSIEVMRKISVKCQHYLWDYKHTLTTSDFFDKVTKEECETDLDAAVECKNAGVGHKAPCLLDSKEKIKEDKCLSFLDEISVIIFSDYHLIYKFVDKCKSDIVKFKCGRMTKPGVKDMIDEDSTENPVGPGKFSYLDYITSQAHTVDCLIEAIQDIGDECQHQILRLSELQSNDYHLNRGLYLACRDDRELLCHKVRSGEGRVYSCLMKHKSSEKMSQNCKDMLTKKQQVESMDVRANYPLYNNCKKDLKENNCFKDTDEINQGVVLMSVILMCLHDAEIQGKKLESNCYREVSERRAEMIEDLNISPEVIRACKDDIKKNCNKEKGKPGEVVHCLMKLAVPDLKNKEGMLSNICKVEIEKMLKVANPTENILTNDPAIRMACSSSYMTLCSDINTDNEAFQCLVDNINSPKMAVECREKITSLLYFVSLDISIDDRVNVACHNDAARLCNAPNTVEETMKRTEAQKQLEYHCMYEHFMNDRIKIEFAQAQGWPQSKYNMTLSPSCGHAIFNMIKAQSSKIEIDPLVFMTCFKDLGRFCSSSEFKGKEHECLQSSVKKLEPSCRKAVIEFSQLEDVDTRFNHMLNEACEPMIKQFCPHEKPEDAAVCLTEHKTHPQMSENCAAAIEHMQIMSLEEYHIDHRFASFCGPEIEKYCKEELLKVNSGKEDKDRNNKVISKATIVSCLSKTVVENLLHGEKHPLSDVCRRQFTFELLQRSETIKLDPGLKEDCDSDIKHFCTKVNFKDINSCLREHQDELSDTCHKRLFRRERLEALDADFDGELQHKCSEMIHERCHNVPGSQIFRCLRRQMNDEDFDRDCKKLIMLRLERRMNDIRLNPGLLEDCKKDIKRYCSIDDKPSSGIEYEGKIILCLKIQFVNSSKSLQKNCRQRIHEIIMEASTNMRLDPALRTGCKKDMTEHCSKEMKDERDDAVNSVHNCLKYKFLRGEIRSPICKKEIARLLKEGMADVHVDTELFNACENAIIKLCRSQSLGNGRKMNCLLAWADDPKASLKLEDSCLSMLKDRKEMWIKAGHYDSQSLQELYHHVTSSSTKGYLLSMLGLMILALILLGICCGRVSKRVAVDLKNK